MDPILGQANKKTSNAAGIGQIAITGAASGMGLATAHLLASRGAIISLADLNETALATALESLPCTSTGPTEKKHIAFVIDVRDSQTVDSWIEETVRSLGRLDGAVNMAGVILPACPVANMTDQEWDFVMGVNARGVFSCIRAQVNAMGGGGSIVSINLFFESRFRRRSRWRSKIQSTILSVYDCSFFSLRCFFSN